MLVFGLLIFLRPDSCAKSTGEVGEGKKKSVRTVGFMFMSFAAIQAMFSILNSNQESAELTVDHRYPSVIVAP